MLWKREKFLAFAMNKTTFPQFYRLELSHYTSCTVPAAMIHCVCVCVWARTNLWSSSEFHIYILYIYYIYIYI